MGFLGVKKRIGRLGLVQTLNTEYEYWDLEEIFCVECGNERERKGRWNVSQVKRVIKAEGSQLHRSLVIVENNNKHRFSVANDNHLTLKPSEFSLLSIYFLQLLSLSPTS